MRRFITKLLLYAGILFLIFAIADYFLSNYLRKSNVIEFQAWNGIYNQNLDNDVIIMGSSRAFVQFNPRIIDSVLHVNSYNLGYNGSLVNRQIERYYAYCRIQKHEPQTIIYSIDYGTLSGISTNFEREQFYPYFFYDRDLMRQFDKYQHFSLMEKYIPFWRYCSCFFDFHVYDVFTNPEEKEIFYKGFKNERMQWDASVLLATAEQDYHCNDQALQIFNDFIEDVSSKGRNVIFVYSPAYKEFLNKFRHLDRMYQIFADIAKRHNIPVLDYTKDSICNDTSFFYNATHLNKVGADIFSLQVSKDIDNLKLLSRLKDN